ncbi:MAG TPA: periplasmic heavy metal sensor [Planctomycetota bacterium]|nr:periplasmic heavy metal sensor [Planctomycetota bacterium]
MTARPARPVRALPLAFAAGIALLLCAADAQAQAGRQRRGPARREALARQLDLTEAQREQMRAAAGDHRQSVQETREAVRAAGRALKAALAGRARDAATIEASRAALRQARDAARAARLARRDDVGAALTPGQREQLQAIREARRALRRP